MSEQVILRSQPIMDPAGEASVRPAELAERQSSLKGKQILLIDNGQLTIEWSRYGKLFDFLADILAAKYGTNSCHRMRDELLQGSRGCFEDLAAQVGTKNVHGVVMALGHAGVTIPSILLCSYLEKAEIPAVLICTGLGGPLAAIAAQTYVPGLPIITIQPDESDTEEKIQAVATAIANDVVEGLTLSKAELKSRFQSLISPRQNTLRASGGGGLEVKVRSTLTATANNSGELSCVVDPSHFAEALYEALCDSDMCDGFPVIAPTRERVDRTLAFTDREPGEIILDEIPPSGAPITVEKLAINAVMAGCKPEYFPIVLTAFEAMAEPRYRLFQAAITTHPGGNAVIVSGPLAKELGIQSGAACLGPGFRANATIGRAITLSMINIARAIPGRSDLSTFGSPAEYSYCFAELLESNPWTPFHVEFRDSDTTAVTVHKVEGPQNVIAQVGKRPEQILTAIANQAATLGGNNYYWPSDLIVLLNPSHAKIMADAGWSKDDVKFFLFDHARIPVEPVKTGRGIPPAWPAWFRAADRVPVVYSPHDIYIFVAGAIGPHDMVCKPWGLTRLVTKAVTFKDGRPIRSVSDFKKRLAAK